MHDDSLADGEVAWFSCTTLNNDGRRFEQVGAILAGQLRLARRRPRGRMPWLQVHGAEAAYVGRNS